MSWFEDIVCLLLAYLLGGFCTGYYLVRFRTGKDLRILGSGSVGARNVGRVLGRTGFLLTVLGDGLKGVAAVWIARRFGSGDDVAALSMVAVVAGHIWPPALRFHGGRGIVTAIGAFLAYDARLTLILLALTLGMMVTLRRGFALGGLGAFALLPAAAWFLHLSGAAVAASAAVALLVLFAHRERLLNEMREWFPQKEV